MKDQHQCEVRYLLKLRVANKLKVPDYFEAVEKKRGAAAVEKLRADANEQWRLGNKGEYDDWRTDK